MRVIIAGSRSITSYKTINDAMLLAIKDGIRPRTIISGGAKGVDKLGEVWAMDNFMSIDRYPAKWDLHGKSAGYKRNEEMAEHADALVAIWDGQSKGTKHMIDIAKAKKIIVFIVRIEMGDDGIMKFNEEVS